MILRLMRPVAGVAAVVGLAACGHTPATTLIKLRSFDPLTMDPGAVRVAMRAPDWLEPRPGGASIKLRVVRDGESQPELDESYQLELAKEADERRAVAPFAAQGAQIWPFRVTAADAERMRATQAVWRARAAAPKPGEAKWRMTLGAEIAGCRRGEADAGPVVSTTYLRPDVETGYLPLLRDIDLRKVARDAGKDFDAETPPCGKIAERAPALR